MDDFSSLIGQNLALIVLAVVILLAVTSAVKIVPQSEKYVVERFGRLHAVLGPGINLTVPFLDRVAHRISILERQLPTNSQDAITADNVLVQVETSVFYRIIEPEKTVYRIRDIDAAIATRFKDRLREIVLRGRKPVRLDMRRVDFMDSSGLGAMIAVRKALPEALPLVLDGLTPNVERVFRLTRMDSVFEIRPANTPQE